MADPSELVCSAKDCDRRATARLLWNNPKIHPPERRKVWLACDEHRATLTDFLGARGFMRDTTPIAVRHTGPALDDD